MNQIISDMLLKYTRSFQLCGSRVTCNPPPTDTDQDWIVLISEENNENLKLYLVNNNWFLGGSNIPDEINELPPDARFESFTRGEDNLIITQSPIFYQKFIAATQVCKRLNLLKKDDRIAVFQAVLYGRCDIGGYYLPIHKLPNLC